MLAKETVGWDDRQRGAAVATAIAMVPHCVMKGQVVEVFGAMDWGLSFEVAHFWCIEGVNEWYSSFELALGVFL